MKYSKNLIFAFATLAIALTTVFSLSAFKTKTPINLAYQYTGANESGLMTSSNWTPITYNPTPTECDEIGDLACVVQFNDTQYDDIQDFLTTKGSASAVNTATEAQRFKEPVNP